MNRPNVRNLLVHIDDGPRTAYVTSIWTVQRGDGPMDRLCYVNLNRPNGRRSNGPSKLRQFGPSKWTTVQWTVVYLDGPLDRLYYGNLHHPNLWLLTILLDRPKILLWTESYSVQPCLPLAATMGPAGRSRVFLY